MALKPSSGPAASSATKTSTHPTYEEMIKAGVLALQERMGSSRQALKKYILANFKVVPGARFDNQFNAGIRRGVSKGVFALPKGASGRVKIAKLENKTTEKMTTDDTKKKAAAPEASRVKSSALTAVTKKTDILTAATSAARPKRTSAISKKTAVHASAKKEPSSAVKKIAMAVKRGASSKDTAKTKKVSKTEKANLKTPKKATTTSTHVSRSRTTTKEK